jgi:hypothetical protein
MELLQRLDVVGVVEGEDVVVVVPVGGVAALKSKLRLFRFDRYYLSLSLIDFVTLVNISFSLLV